MFALLYVKLGLDKEDIFQRSYTVMQLLQLLFQVVGRNYLTSCGRQCSRTVLDCRSSIFRFLFTSFFSRNEQHEHDRSEHQKEAPEDVHRLSE